MPNATPVVTVPEYQDVTFVTGATPQLTATYPATTPQQTALGSGVSRPVTGQIYPRGDK